MESQVSEPLNSAQIILADGIATRVVETLIRTVAIAAIKPPQKERAVIGHNGAPDIDSPTDDVVFTVDEFCARNKISKSNLYGLWKRGVGPQFYKSGASTRITSRAEREWHHEREAAASSPRRPPASAS
jgi:hypothetical protein